jgi:hypothetical protein
MPALLRLAQVLCKLTFSWHVCRAEGYECVLLLFNEESEESRGALFVNCRRTRLFGWASLTGTLGSSRMRGTCTTFPGTMHVKRCTATLPRCNGWTTGASLWPPALHCLATPGRASPRLSHCTSFYYLPALFQVPFQLGDPNPVSKPTTRRGAQPGHAPGVHL